MPVSLQQENDEQTNFNIVYRKDPATLTDVCLFSSFSFSGTVEEYVYHYLQALQQAGLAIVFISTSPIKKSCTDRLASFAFLIIERENTCPDFGSWKVALSLLDWGQSFRSVLLTNDSIFGPFFDIGGIISSMKDKYDVWGMTENYEISYHLQSYFIYFNKKVAGSQVFGHFWKQVDLMASKKEVIDKYEVGLSVLLRKNNFTLGAYATIEALAQDQHVEEKEINITLASWKVLIEKFRFPFLKRELLIKFDIARTYWTINFYVNTSGWKKSIENASSYPTMLIDQFLLNYQAFLRTKDILTSFGKRKIMFVCHSAARGDGQQMLISFLRWLKMSTGSEAEILICNKDENEIENDLAGLGVVTYLYTLTAAGKQFLKQRLAEEIAMIFSFTTENIATQKFLSVLNIPQFIFIHESPAVLKECLTPEDTRWLKTNIVQFIAATDTIKKTLSSLGADHEKTALLYKFVDDGNMPVFDQRQPTRNDLKIPVDAFVVGIIDQPGDEKYLDLFMAIATAICREDNTIHLVWLGKAGAKNKPNPADLAMTNLTARVHIIENDTVQNQYFNLVDVVVMAARNDSFSLWGPESGLAGKPFICFADADGTDEYTGFGTGYAVPYLNISELAEKVLTYYHERHMLVNEQHRIHQLVSTHFTTQVQAPKIWQLILQNYSPNERVLLENPSITFFTHLYYENSWNEIRNKLKNFDNGQNQFLFSISDACLAKEEIIKDIKTSFASAYFVVTSNIGKDIGGKMALIDIYLLLDLRTSYIVFLHDKQSPHSIQGESWKNGLFKIIEYNNRKMILNFFKDPSIGIIGSKDHIINEYDSATGNFVNNSQLSKKLMLQFGLEIDNYDFLGGTMYWMRGIIIERFFKKNNPILLRENLEAGNVMDLHGERLAHTWERMFSWIATNQGFTIKGI